MSDDFLSSLVQKDFYSIKKKFEEGEVVRSSWICIFEILMGRILTVAPMLVVVVGLEEQGMYSCKTESFKHIRVNVFFL